MRQVHRAGEKCFVDYAGQKPRLIDPTTGEVLEVELFVAALGASNYTYAEATRTQQVPDCLSRSMRAWRNSAGRGASGVPAKANYSCQDDPPRTLGPAQAGRHLQ